MATYQPEHGFRCLAFADGNRYKAVCLDLSIYVEGPSLAAARADLDTAVLTYLEQAKQYGAESDLVPRRVPWDAYAYFYAKICWLNLQAVLGSLIQRRQDYGQQTVNWQLRLA